MFHYREYLRLMEHWRKTVAPRKLFEIDYEELVADKETVTRQMLDFCGLPWDDACLHHDQKSSSVTTPSRWQARQPIYTAQLRSGANTNPGSAVYSN